jgi:anti-sigma-K factor RskA
VNIKEYISSGIVESYVLGLVSAAERIEFESLCVQYPEILEARIAFEQSLEEQLLSDARQPPQHLKQLIESRIASLGPESYQDDDKEVRSPVRNIAGWKWLAAASLILLAGAIYWAIDSNNKFKNLQADNKILKDSLNQSSTRLNAMREDENVLRNPGLKMAALKGTAHAPQALATVFWDTASTSKDVYLLVNNLPQPASDKQYQLWAMLDGKPIDLGLLDMEIREKRLLVKMKNVQNAEAFAITLEPRGGSPQPTVDSMYVQGAL